VLGADQCGAPHRRRRLWILAESSSWGFQISGSHQADAKAGGLGEVHLDGGGGHDRWHPNTSEDGTLADSKGVRWPQRSNVDGHPPKDEQTRGWGVPDTTHSGRGSGRCIDWPTEPDVGRVANGVASRMDRLTAIGNGQVPRVVAAAWELLSA
jgi:DNA (cytosine-5)-methyltransferase 1